MSFTIKSLHVNAGCFNTWENFTSESNTLTNVCQFEREIVARKANSECFVVLHPQKF